MDRPVYNKSFYLAPVIFQQSLSQIESSLSRDSMETMIHFFELNDIQMILKANYILPEVSGLVRKLTRKRFG